MTLRGRGKILNAIRISAAIIARQDHEAFCETRDRIKAICKSERRSDQFQTANKAGVGNLVRLILAKYRYYFGYPVRSFRRCFGTATPELLAVFACNFAHTESPSDCVEAAEELDYILALLDEEDLAYGDFLLNLLHIARGEMTTEEHRTKLKIGPNAYAQQKKRVLKRAAEVRLIKHRRRKLVPITADDMRTSA